MNHPFSRQNEMEDGQEHTPPFSSFADTFLQLNRVKYKWNSILYKIIYFLLSKVKVKVLLANS
jgi:hypothetical protein